MGKNVSSFLTVALAALSVGLFSSHAHAGTYSGGTGDPNEPYQIADANDLLELAGETDDYDRCFVLTADIILDPNNNPAHIFTMAVIAPDTDSATRWYQGTQFAGSFDGAGFVISNLTIDTAGAYNDYLGLFGYIGTGSEVKNIGIVNVSITGKDTDYLGGLCGESSGTISNCYVSGSVSVSGGRSSSILGGLCGRNDGGTISNCYASGSVSLSGMRSSRILGGLCGENSGTISNCYASGSVSGRGATSILGGLCGRNDGGTISDCYAIGSVSGMHGSRILGGLCGANDGTISNCYASGSVTGDSDIGGLCGDNYGTIINCYSSGSVTGGYFLGGLCGYNDGGTISNCSASGAVTGWGYLGGLCGENYSGMINNCYASGTVTGDSSLGGVCGFNYYGTVRNCYARGVVTGGAGSYSLGGVCGFNKYSGYTACFWDITVNPALADCGYDYYTASYDADLPEVFAETTANMQIQSTFTNAGWDFEDIWRIKENHDYPRLLWENTPPVADAGADITAYALVDGHALLQLDGMGSYDADGDALTYLWTWEVGGEVYDANTVNPVIELGVGEYEITLVVNDGLEDSEPNEVVVTVVGPVEVDVRVMPRVLNRKSRGRYVLAVMQLPDGIGGDDIDESYGFVLEPGGIDATSWRVLGRRGKRIVFAMFDRARLIDATEGTSAGAGGARGVEVSVVGRLISGEYIYGADVVRIIEPGKRPRPGGRR